MKSKVLKTAWAIFRKGGYTFSDALSISWSFFKKTDIAKLIVVELNERINELARLRKIVDAQCEILNDVAFEGEQYGVYTQYKSAKLALTKLPNFNGKIKDLILCRSILLGECVADGGNSYRYPQVNLKLNNIYESWMR